MPNILVVDNYDSFTHNLVHYLEKLNCDVTVVFNDQLVDNIASYDGIVLSPGPGLPQEAGGLAGFIESTAGRIPILGVCLGLQAIAEYLGGKLYNQEQVKHGVQEEIQLFPGTLFDEKKRTEVGLYHSWAIDRSGDYLVTAESDTQVVMAIENVGKQLFAVQFHPESIMTKEGLNILSNFINFCITDK